MLGASAAAAIARRGSEVALLSADPVGSTPTSRASFAWVNAHGKAPLAYQRLNEQARSMHRERSANRDEPWFFQTGADIDGRIAPDDGYVDTEVFIRSHSAELRDAGGRQVAPTTVRDLHAALEIAGPADTVVVAAGSGTSALLAASGIRSRRLRTSAGAAGFLVRIEVAQHPIRRIISTSGLQIRPDGDGRVAVQSLNIEAQLRESGALATVESVWPALRSEIEEKLGWCLAADIPIRVDEAPRAHGPDALPVVGRVADDVYVALSHSGVTLAPLLAELLARDLEGDPDPRLAPFRP